MLENVSALGECCAMARSGSLVLPKPLPCIRVVGVWKEGWLKAPKPAGSHCKHSLLIGFLFSLRSSKLQFAMAVPISAARSVTNQRRRKPLAKAEQAYVPPARAPGGTELDDVERYSVVVPDQLLGQSFEARPAAATMTCGILAGEMARASREAESAVAHGVERAQGEGWGNDGALDAALCNLGAQLAEEVPGRVSTEVDPRVAHDTEAVVDRAKRLANLYEELEVGKDKFLVKVPATWECIQAVPALEREGIRTHVTLVFSEAQGAAAIDAGASIIQPYVGRVRARFESQPSSRPSAFKDPGKDLVARVFARSQSRQPRTLVMAASLRGKQDVFDLCGCDFLVVAPRTYSSLLSTPSSSAGYNDGIHGAAAAQEGLSPLERRVRSLQWDKLEPWHVSHQDFEGALSSSAAGQLLADGLQGYIASAQRCEEILSKFSLGAL